MLFLFCIIPLCIPFITKHFFNRDLTWKELGICVVAPIVLMCCFYFGAYYTETADVEILNGAVTQKTRDEVHCRHSYDCNCYYTYSTRRDSHGRSHTSRTKHCSTCYEHRFDVDWDVATSVGNYSIDKVDRQGLIEPPRWTAVSIGEPVSKTSSYTNYVLGAKNSLFNLSQYQQYANMVPEYPKAIYDLWKIDRVVQIGTNIPNKADINQGLSEILSLIGPKKQVNIVLVTTNKAEDFSYAIRNKWLGGKKNDLIITVGIDNTNKINWVKVFGWSNNQMVYIRLRDDLMKVGNITDTANILSVISTDVAQFYQRKHMKDFEYLKDEVQPSMTTLLIGLILSVLLSIGLTWYCVKKDVA